MLAADEEFEREARPEHDQGGNSSTSDIPSAPRKHNLTIWQRLVGVCCENACVTQLGERFSEQYCNLNNDSYGFARSPRTRNNNNVPVNTEQPGRSADGHEMGEGKTENKASNYNMIPKPTPYFGTSGGGALHNETKDDRDLGREQDERRPDSVEAIMEPINENESMTDEALLAAMAPHYLDEDDPDNCEPMEDYRPGGYHPIKASEILNDRFKIIRKLGWGMYSTVWMGEDIGTSKMNSTRKNKSPNRNRLVALKIQKSSQDYYQAARNEIKLLHTIRAEEDKRNDPSFIVRLHDAFEVPGPNGIHPCMVFEPLGESLFGVMQQYNSISLTAVRKITAQLLCGLRFLHSCRILHTDLKPENVLVVRRPHSNSELAGFGLRRSSDHDQLKQEFSEGSSTDVVDDKPIYLADDDPIIGVKIVDLGNAFFIDEQEALDIQTREYRCIESMLGVRPFKPAADIWSLGCLTFELLTGETLFDPQLPEGVDPSVLEEGDFIKDESHLVQCVELIGQIPPSLVVLGDHSSEWFEDDGTWRNDPGYPASADGVILEILKDNFQIEDYDAQMITEFIQFTLVYDPKKRPLAEECLAHPFCAGPMGGSED